LPCPSWLAWLVERDNPFTRTNRAAVILDHLDLRPGMTVLDIGCGPGRLAIPAARAVGPEGRVVAVDVQPAMLARAAEKAREAGLDNIRFEEARVGSGELGSPAADRALLVTVLGEIPDREAALREVFDALAPGGILSITELVFDPHFQSQRKVRSLARAAGFVEEALFGSRIAYTIHLRKPGC
jgi:ubiquinone/menaquinone biosynthesis C-methylase UbiE